MLPVLGFFAGITPPEALHRIGKVEGKGASEQFKERDETHEPKSTTTTVIQNSSQFLFSYASGRSKFGVLIKITH